VCDKIAGTEILDAVKRFGSKDVFKKVTLEDLALHARASTDFSEIQP
jgi:hypothetical protein